MTKMIDLIETRRKALAELRAAPDHDRKASKAAGDAEHLAALALLSEPANDADAAKRARYLLGEPAFFDSDNEGYLHALLSAAIVKERRPSLWRIQLARLLLWLVRAIDGERHAI
jgi:hypothetical protein